jgi:hypothetical protein
MTILRSEPLARAAFVILVAAGGAACGGASASSAPSQPPSAPAATVSAAPEPLPGALPANVGEAAARNRKSFDDCYERARAVNPNLGSTRVDVVVELDASGKPVTVDVHYKHKFDEAAKDCMRTAALALRVAPTNDDHQHATLLFEPRAP